MSSKAIKSMRTKLQAEIDAIMAMINVMGAGTWRMLLMYFMKKGILPQTLAKGLFDVAEDDVERRDIINTITNGLQDLYDALLAHLEILLEEEADMNKRRKEI